MKSQPIAQRTSLAGAVVIVAGAASPLGAAVTRRLAGEAGVLVMAVPDPSTLAPVLEDVSRVRTLNRLPPLPEVLAEDPTHEDGAEAVIRMVLQTYGRVDAVVYVGEGATLPDEQLPLVRWGAAALARQIGGRLVLALAAPQGGGREADDLATAFSDLVRAAARTYLTEEVCINGVLVETTGSAADRALALTTGTAPRRPDPVLNAAAGLVGLLASALGCGMSGQVFRVNGAPLKGGVEPNLAALVGRKVILQ